MARSRNHVIVGASLAGLSAAETLRKEGYEDRITLIGEEHAPPYDRPPLSKQVLGGDWEPERAQLRSEAHLEALQLEWKLGQQAAALDIGARQVVLASGEAVAYDGLVVATGAAARRLPGAPSLGGIHVLRTLDDAIALRADLGSHPRVCVIGAGFIGTEVAAACRGRGLDVTVVSDGAAPLASALPAELSSAVGALHLDRGVELRCATQVEGFEGGARVEAVRLAGGATVPADVVVIGVGAVPATGWLASSGLPLDDGVVCDATLATPAPDVVAAGDVARWPSALFDETMRLEHWTNALEQGAAAARRLLHGAEGTRPFAPVPYVWSDQYETTIQMMGRIKPGDAVRVVHGSYGEGHFVALTGRAGRLVGAVAFNEARRLRPWRQQIAERVSWDDALGHARSPVT